mmetsp:Transcript_15783/g.43284  ORF Transcript_15783/g.43284 Transcript_15783/m.43284 type:complete len:142 (-) Transcript_15783:1645-2070(-)
MLNLTVREKMVAPVYMYYKMSNFYQNHRKYVRDRSDAQLAGESDLKPGQLECTALKARYPSGSPELTSAGWTYNSIQNVISPCGLIAFSVFNDSCVHPSLAPLLVPVPMAHVSGPYSRCEANFGSPQPSMGWIRRSGSTKT